MKIEMIIQHSGANSYPFSCATSIPYKTLQSTEVLSWYEQYVQKPEMVTVIYELKESLSEINLDAQIDQLLEWLETINKGIFPCRLRKSK